MPVYTGSTEVNLADTWKVLVRRRWVALSFFLICTSLVSLGTFLMTPLYRAETTIMIEGESTNVLRAEESSSGSASYDIFENYLETQMTLVRSRSVAGKVFEEFRLGETPRYQKKEGFWKILQHKFGEDIYLERVPGTRIVGIAVENPDPKTAADVANRLAQIYVQDNLMRRALTFIRNQRMASLNADFLNLQSRYDTLSNQFGPKHPEMIALKDEIRKMAQRMESERSGSDGISKDQNPAEGQAVLEDALLKLQESSVLSSSRMSNVGIVDPAVLPKEIAKPRRVLNITLGFLAGLFGGIFLALFIDYLDDSIKTDEDVKKQIGGHIFLGSIHSENGAKNNPKRQTNIDHVVMLRGESPSAEAYRLLRTRILWSAAKESPLKDIAILSPGPGEGKTTIASNLAIALSQMKFRVLLVDTDIRRGRLHSSYDLPNDKGLGQYLTDHLPLESVIKKTDIPDLSIVTCGESIIDSSQLLSSSRMSDFIRETRARFDIILYDTPPITMISDASILVSQITAAVLTIRSGYTNTKVLSRALLLIKESEAKLIGVLLNAADSNHPSYYYKYYQRA